MLDYDAWRSSDVTPISATSRAADAWARILRRPTQIVIARGDDDLSPQTVRVDVSSTSSGSPEVDGMSGASSKLNAVVFGVRNHPLRDAEEPDEAVPDTDILRDDRFALDRQWFRVVHVVYEEGEIQALCEVIS